MISLAVRLLPSIFYAFGILVSIIYVFRFLLYSIIIVEFFQRERQPETNCGYNQRHIYAEASWISP
jgi:hypothetical protein